MKSVAIKDVLDFLTEGSYSFTYSGDENAVITKFSNLNDIQDNSIAWVKNKKYLTEEIAASVKKHLSAVIVCPCHIADAANCLITDSPKEVYFSVLNAFFKERRCTGISERAAVETDRIGRNVSIGAGCCVCKDAVIGDDVILHPNVVIDCPCTIGRGTEIFSGTVIGSDGFGYYHHNGIPERVPHFGGVIIGENVDIGANTCIDRGTLGDTVIGDNVKIDNHCHVGHNVRIGARTLVVAGTTICGSVSIGTDSYIAPEATIKNQVKMGAKTFVGMNTVLSKDIEPMSMVVDFKQSAQVLKNKDYTKFL